MRLYTITLMALVLAIPLAAQRPANAASAGAVDRDTTKPTPVPAEQSSVTDHTIRVAGQVVAYRATAATMLLKNDKDESIRKARYNADQVLRELLAASQAGSQADTAA